MQNLEDFTHFDDQGRARMVDVGEKAPAARPPRGPECWLAAKPLSSFAPEE